MVIKVTSIVEGVELMQKTKVYATDCYLLTDDEEHFEKINHIITVALGLFDTSNRAVEILSNMYKRYRLANEIDFVIGYVSVLEDKKIYVIHFETIKSNNEIYNIVYDISEGNHYIEI